MSCEGEVAIEVVDDIIQYIYNKYPKLSCGDYISIASLFSYNVGTWVSKSMNESPAQVLVAVINGIASLDGIHDE
ncbi:MAG: hypothetical protein M0R51_18150 [Clostridia bacterium]|jgi:hypothetical protein|nr:hypothetical protein [Clostridia bacterium]